MSRTDRERWDLRHEAANTRPAMPSPTLRWLPPAVSGHDRALDLACGSGRHTRALIDAGYRVVAADFSRVALAALRTAEARRTEAIPVLMDVESWPLADSSFDVVVQVDFLDRDRIETVRRAVKPGGLVLIDTFAGTPRPGRPGPQRAAWRVTHGELAERFADWQVLRVDDGPSHERAAILARRPFAAGTRR